MTSQRPPSTQERIIDQSVQFFRQALPDLVSHDTWQLGQHNLFYLQFDANLPDKTTQQHEISCYDDPNDPDLKDAHVDVKNIEEARKATESNNGKAIVRAMIRRARHKTDPRRQVTVCLSWPSLARIFVWVLDVYGLLGKKTVPKKPIGGQAMLLALSKMPMQDFYKRCLGNMNSLDLYVSKEGNYVSHRVMYCQQCILQVSNLHKALPLHPELASWQRLDKAMLSAGNRQSIEYFAMFDVSMVKSETTTSTGDSKDAKSNTTEPDYAGNLLRYMEQTQGELVGFLFANVHDVQSMATVRHWFIHPKHDSEKTRKLLVSAFQDCCRDRQIQRIELQPPSDGASPTYATWLKDFNPFSSTSTTLASSSAELSQQMTDEEPIKAIGLNS